MVIDKLKNAPIYYGLGPRFRRALEWLSRADPDALPAGQRISIDGDDIFATLFDTETLPPEQCRLEFHHNYADIQYLVSGREGEAIPLTVKEYDLLLHLAANQGLVLKRGEILNAVWGYTFYGSDRVVDDTIRRLRKKLPAIEIRTLYGLGYCLTEGDHESFFD